MPFFHLPMKKIIRSIVTILLVCLYWFACENSTKPEKVTGRFTGTVIGVQSGTNVPVSQAYIITNDSLLAITDENGVFDIAAIKEGDYEIICSALFYADTVMELTIEADQTVNHDFTLEPDSATGKVYGEFQDGDFWIQMLNEGADLADWDAESVWAGVTGATLQSKTVGFLVPDRTVALEDSVLAFTDGFGQYWFRIPNGTYPFTGSCEGYQSVTKVVTVPANDRVYLNFILPRE
jgi:hypothetical protein